MASIFTFLFLLELISFAFTEQIFLSFDTGSDPDRRITHLTFQEVQWSLKCFSLAHLAQRASETDSQQRRAKILVLEAHAVNQGSRGAKKKKK